MYESSLPHFHFPITLAFVNSEQIAGIRGHHAKTKHQAVIPDSRPIQKLCLDGGSKARKDAPHGRRAVARSGLLLRGGRAVHISQSRLGWTPESARSSLGYLKVEKTLAAAQFRKASSKNGDLLFGRVSAVNNLQRHQTCHKRSYVEN